MSPNGSERKKKKTKWLHPQVGTPSGAGGGGGGCYFLPGPLFAAVTKNDRPEK